VEGAKGVCPEGAKWEIGKEMLKLGLACGRLRAENGVKESMGLNDIL